MFSINMLNGFFDPIVNWFSNFFYFLSVGVYYIFICGIGRIVDIIQLLFRKFAGLEDMSLNGQEGDIVMQFLNSSIVQQVFWAMLVLAIILLFITTFAAVIKTEFNKDGNNSKKKVLRNTFKAIANFVVVPVVCMFGLIVGNALLKTIDAASNPSGDTISMTSQIFVAGGYNSNRVRKYEGTGDNAVGYKKGTMASYMTGGEVSGKNYGSFGIFYDDATGIVKQSAADKIDDAFAKNITINLDQLRDEERTLIYVGGEDGEYKYSYSNNFDLARFPDDVDDFNFTLGGNSGYTFPKESSITFSVYNLGLVSYYYDLSLFNFDYLVCVIALIFSAWVYLITILGLIKRLFMLVTLYIISPPVCALYPLDDGKALSKWREEFIKQALSAYSVVIVMNVFFLLLPLMMQIEIMTAGTSWFNGKFAAGLINYLARVLVVIGALMFFKDATKTIASIIGSESAYDSGASKATELARRTVGGAMVAGRLMGIGKPKGPKSGGSGGSNGSSGGGKNPNQQDIDNTANYDSGGAARSSTGTGNGSNSMNDTKPSDKEIAIQKQVDDQAKEINDSRNRKVNIGKSIVGGLAATAATVATGGLAAIPIGLHYAKKGIGAIGKNSINKRAKKIEDLKKTYENKKLSVEERAQAKAKMDRLQAKVKKGNFKHAFGAMKDNISYAFTGALAVARGDKLGDIKKDAQSFDKRRGERLERKAKEQEDYTKKVNQRVDELEKQAKEKSEK